MYTSRKVGLWHKARCTRARKAVTVVCWFTKSVNSAGSTGSENLNTIVSDHALASWDGAALSITGNLDSARWANARAETIGIRSAVGGVDDGSVTVAQVFALLAVNGATVAQGTKALGFRIRGLNTGACKATVRVGARAVGCDSVVGGFLALVDVYITVLTSPSLLAGGADHA